MKQIIPFHKEIIFRTMIGEITSISLEHTLKFSDENSITGDFIVSGSYKMTEASQIEEDFDYHIPVDITIDENYDIRNSKIDIDDFYYEIVNDEILKVNIDVLITGMEKEEQKEEPEIILLDEEIDQDYNQDDISEEKKQDLTRDINIEQKMEESEQLPDNQIPILQTEISEKELSVDPSSTTKIDSIFSAFKDTDETFSTYSVCIVRENDTLDSILDRYKCTKEEIENYNDLNNLTIGSKLIIPSSKKDE